MLRYARENPCRHFLRYRQYCASMGNASHENSFLLDLLITTSYGILGRDLYRKHTEITSLEISLPFLLQQKLKIFSLSLFQLHKTLFLKQTIFNKHEFKLNFIIFNGPNS
jgi:hypothetical protein